MQFGARWGSGVGREMTAFLFFFGVGHETNRRGSKVSGEGGDRGRGGRGPSAAQRPCGTHPSVLRGCRICKLARISAQLPNIRAHFTVTYGCAQQAAGARSHGHLRPGTLKRRGARFSHASPRTRLRCAKGLSLCAGLSLCDARAMPSCRFSSRAGAAAARGPSAAGQPLAVFAALPLTATPGLAAEQTPASLARICTSRLQFHCAGGSN